MTTTDEEPDCLGFTSADYAGFAAESRARQGLPPRITDPVVLDNLADLIKAMRRGQQGHPGTGPESPR
jgi:hypothetical protein